VARIQTPQHVQDLQAEFKVREGFGLDLLETIQPVTLVGGQKVASSGYPRKSFGVISAGTGGAGTNIELALRCPAGRGIIILLESVSFDNVGGEVSARFDDGVAMTPISSTPTTKKFRDGRIEANIPDGILEVANPLSAAANGTFIGQYSCLAGDTVFVPVDVVLGDDSYYLIRNSADNAGLEVNFMWTEFLLEDR